MKRRSTLEFFSSYANGFNAIYGSKNTFINKLVNRSLRKSMKLRYQNTLEGCNPIGGKTVLDIGCGPGHFAIALAKMGAKEVVGLDFAKSMLDMAQQNAKSEGILHKCKFIDCDFFAYQTNDKYDYTIAMGFMDYMENSKATINKILSFTKGKAFISFPAQGGILAWQRRLRYKLKCNLFMYTQDQIKDLFLHAPCKRIVLDRLSRDYFVTAFM
jgi:2-polyprenyl-3-methyl-5-hydroxy-6-metoxy-1,4-benzoquinol methylase